MKSEFIALDKAGEEVEWLRNFLEDILYWPKPVAPVCIHCDSQAAIGKAGSIMYNGKSHHIQRRHNIVRELLSHGIITVDYVKSKDNVSDPLIKGLSREGVERTSKGMGLRPRTSQHGAGHVLVFPSYNGFFEKPGLFLDQMFVRKCYRGMRLGKLLFSTVAMQAEKMGMGMVDWLVADWNEETINFYEKMGAHYIPEYRLCKLYGDKLQAFGNKID
ncbi:putative acetyltransferase NATA1-like [Capsicum annuum]|uniref:Acetyltransferase NATA1-like n=1 Tax=Capsicum annuum TaxID=4072 RepID=A0A2G2ZFZ1_CAPAN|nr:putative acetyltransferase NATA1-like [Capsicum annuum]